MIQVSMDDVEIGDIVRNDNYGFDLKVIGKKNILHPQTNKVTPVVVVKPITMCELPAHWVTFKKGIWWKLKGITEARYHFGQGGDVFMWLHHYKRSKPKSYDWGKLCMIPECDNPKHLVPNKSVANPNRTKR